MDLMDIRRTMMGVIAGMAGKVPRLIYNKQITFEETATFQNRKALQLPIIQNGFICILIDEMPTEPDPTIYIALSSYQVILTKYNNTGTGTNILRPNGTVGSDSGGSGYIRSTGTLYLGGNYAYYPEGMTYNIYAFEIADAE